MFVCVAGFFSGFRYGPAGGLLEGPVTYAGGSRAMGKDTLIWCLSIVGTLAASAAQGFVEPDQTREMIPGGQRIGIRVVRPELSKASRSAFGPLEAASTLIRTDKRSGAPRVITGKGLVTSLPFEQLHSEEGYVELARRFVEENSGALGFSFDDLELNKEATLITDDVQFIKFKLRRDGLLVDDANVDFRFKHGRLMQVINHSFAEARPDNRPGRDGLGEIAASALITKDAQSTGERYRIVENGQGYDLVRVAQFEVTSQDDQQFQVQVETATGKIFEIRPRAFHLNGSATQEVHARWYNQPLEAKASPYLSLATGSTPVVTTIDGIFEGAQGNAQPKIDGFSGTFVKVNPETGSRAVANGSMSNGQWKVEFKKNGNSPANDDKTMAQSMVFYHTNAIVTHAKKYISSAWMDRQLQANVNLGQNCNAYWDGSTINFFSAGGGCANTGLISDVVYHEWGHGLDHNTGGIEDGAYSEGFGDILSLAMTQSNQLGIGFRTNGAPVRDLAPDKVYPKDRGEVHAEGLIIGSTFYDLFQNLAATYGGDEAAKMISNYAFKTVFTASRYTDVYDALLVIDDNDEDMTNATPNFCAINSVFAAHGLATDDATCKLAGVESVKVDDQESGNGNGVIEPGETVSLTVSAQNGGSKELTGLTADMTVTGTSGVALKNGALSWDAIPARSKAPSISPVVLTVAPQVACGTSINTTVKFKADSRTAAVNRTLLVGKLVGTEKSFAASGLPLRIRDNRTVDASNTIASEEWKPETLIQSLRVKFQIKHSYIGDLAVRLISPSGTSKELFKGGGSGEVVNFDEDVTELFKGQKGAGTWKLRIADEASQDEGTLETFQILATPALFECK